jgi:hypothetical protein
MLRDLSYQRCLLTEGFQHLNEWYISDADGRRVNNQSQRDSIPPKRDTSSRQRSVSKRSVAVNFVESLAAVLLGNAAYLLLSPYMPPLAQHRIFHYDFGMLVDFWFCVVAFGLIKTARWWRKRKRMESAE